MKKKLSSLASLICAALMFFLTGTGNCVYAAEITEMSASYGMISKQGA